MKVIFPHTSKLKNKRLFFLSYFAWMKRNEMYGGRALVNFFQDNEGLRIIFCFFSFPSFFGSSFFFSSFFFIEGSGRTNTDSIIQFLSLVTT